MSLTQTFFSHTHQSGGRLLDLWWLGFFCLSVLKSLLCGFHPDGDLVLHNGCCSSSHHIHNPSIRKQELGQGLLVQKAFTEVPPDSSHVYVPGHSNRARRLPVDPREEGICSLSPGNVAVLSTVEVLLLRKKGKVETGWSLPRRRNLEKQASGVEVTWVTSVSVSSGRVTGPCLMNSVHRNAA